MIRILVRESEEDRTNDEPERGFRPTVEWMSQKYDEMNKRLFNGVLGSCSFDIFTTGRGSEGKTLGKFSIKGQHIFVNRSSRRMYMNDSWMTDPIYIDKGNFVELCSPTILLNGHYSGTEHAFLGTLVHEMCHYYNYMDGWCPKQAHGREFRNIAAVVSSRSDGEFTVQRLATAEEMKEYDLDDDMKAKRERRLQSKKSRMMAVVIYRDTKDVELTLTTSPRIVDQIMDYYQEKHPEKTTKGVCTDDDEIIDFLFQKGYTRAFRTWRFWRINQKPWIDDFNQKIDSLKMGSKETGTYGFETFRADWNPNLAGTPIPVIAEDDSGDMLKILPGMNLGAESPIEMD